MDDATTTHDLCLWFIDVAEGPAEIERCADDGCERCHLVEPQLIEPAAA